MMYFDDMISHHIQQVNLQSLPNASLTSIHCCHSLSSLFIPCSLPYRICLPCSLVLTQCLLSSPLAGDVVPSPEAACQFFDESQHNFTTLVGECTSVRPSQRGGEKGCSSPVRSLWSLWNTLHDKKTLRAYEHPAMSARNAC